MIRWRDLLYIRHYRGGFDIAVRNFEILEGNGMPCPLFGGDDFPWRSAWRCIGRMGGLESKSQKMSSDARALECIQMTPRISIIQVLNCMRYGLWRDWSICLWFISPRLSFVVEFLGRAGSSLNVSKGWKYWSTKGFCTRTYLRIQMNR